VDPASEILPCNGSREGLFYAAFAAVGRKAGSGRPAVLMCNPFYQAYLGGALASGAEPVFLDATEATGHLPDLNALEADTKLLSRTAALYLCSPANPQGAVASEAYIAHALKLARTHDFILFFDECYSEIYGGSPPAGGLEVAAKTPERFRNLVVFNSLSKRSNLP
jgi:N-succinyldiaminopimelate aminotransferase